MSKYHVFVSFSSENETEAESIVKDLEGQGYLVWFSKKSIHPSDVWVREMEEGIDSSSVIVVVWTENAAQSKWVERELIRADEQNKPIIPLIFDDTKVSIVIQTTQHIDFRSSYFKSFPKLVSCLTSLIDDSDVQPEGAGLLWEHTKQPHFRSRFLEDNSYRDRRSVDFAVNRRTQQLISYNEDSHAEAFVTFVAVPIPKAIDIDLSEVSEFMSKSNRSVLGPDNPQFPWERFDISRFDHVHTSQDDHVLYKRHPNPGVLIENMPSLQKQAILALEYIRVNDDGGIEYAEGTYSTRNVKGRHFQGRIFDFIGIVGTCWKFVYLASLVYSRFDYAGRFQLLVNLRNTQGTALGNFARDPHNKQEWQTRLNPPFFLDVENSSWGIADDSNLQFSYNIQVGMALENPSVFVELITHLSRSVVRSFNYKTGDRHFVPNTEEFPWRQFSETSWI